MNFVLILAISAYPDEMQLYAAFHLGLRCLLKYPFKGFQYTKGQMAFWQLKSALFVLPSNQTIDMVIY